MAKHKEKFGEKETASEDKSDTNENHAGGMSAPKQMHDPKHAHKTIGSGGMKTTGKKSNKGMC